MILLLLALPIAIAIGLARGGSFSGWSRFQVYWWPAALLGLGIQVLLFNPLVETHPLALAYGPWLFTATLGLILLTLLRNALTGEVARLPWCMAAAGVALNLLVVAANGGHMPRVEPRWTGGAGYHTDATPRLSNTAPADAETRLAWLGDQLAQPEWAPRANVISIGDLLLYLGMAGLVYAVTAATPRPLRDTARAAGGEPERAAA